ncbi:uncharacterized protein LOC122083559 [Macadamia integrifolia]|uniref:uncharacterized protein LOC122083559 n=1 Tax=Macadamia integrifolia TaxID=60698 RepID=UPI001C4E3548|nr:uncharacterized protein LOC122083559 [Macadamia integrifolia]
MYMVENTPTLMSKTEEEEAEDEEALSLSDLPVVETLKNEKESGNQSRVLEELQEEEFEFGSGGAGSLLKESDMCAAEDVFFQGQILPLRLSVSSDGGIARIGQDSRNPCRCASRSESMDHGFTSSSRSSSIRSGNSNSSSSGSSVTTTITRRSGGGYRERDLSRNHFHAHPSPRPQIWQTTSPAGNGGSRSRGSTAWGLFRPGLVRTPEIELHDLKLKLRNRNKSCESNNNRKEESKKQETKLMKTTTQRIKVRMFERLTSGCKCSVSAVETVPSRLKKVSAIEREENEEQLQQKQQQQEQNKQGKQAMAHRRTFEWLKQLSLADLQQEA